MADSTPVIYLLKSVVRGRDNRTARASQPGRMPFVQRLAGGNIIVRRARPARISEAVLKANLDEIKKAVAGCRIVVTTMHGQLVDLDSFKVAPLAASKPLPNPPLDSAKNDKNENVGYNVPGAPEGTTMDSEMPEILRPSPLMATDELVEEVSPQSPDPIVEEPTVEPEPSPPTMPEAFHHGKHKGKGKRG